MDDPDIRDAEHFVMACVIDHKIKKIAGWHGLSFSKFKEMQKIVDLCSVSDIP